MVFKIYFRQGNCCRLPSTPPKMGIARQENFFTKQKFIPTQVSWYVLLKTTKKKQKKKSEA